MIERHFDYILQIPTLAAGGSLVDYPLPIDTDAPFLARGRGLHVAPPASTRNQSQMSFVRFRYKNASGDDLASIPIQAPEDFWLAYGQGGNYRPIWPEQPYPPGGNILISVYNDGNTDLTNLQVIFRGVKLYRDGTIPNPTYPAQCRVLDFTYQTGKGTQQDAAIVLPTTSALYQIPLSIQADAYFVLRALQAGNWTSSGDGGAYSPYGYTELYVQLFDSQLNRYSNLPIHIDWLFGNAGGSNFPSFVALGNSAPGLIVPEIYLQKNDFLYFNLFRNDAPYVGVTDALPVRLAMAWIGSKIYS